MSTLLGTAVLAWVLQFAVCSFASRVLTETRLCDEISLFSADSVANVMTKKADWKKSLAAIREGAVSTRQFRQHSHSRFDMIGPVGPTCKIMEYYGEGDNEKRACGLISHVDDHCTVISLGSNNEWGFEEDIFKRTSCNVHTFDCTMPDEIEPPQSIRSRVSLHKVCVGPEDEVVGGRKFLSWDSLLALIGISTPPTFLKMDIEGFEWEVLPHIISKDTSPLQISFELHYRTQMKELSWLRSSKSAEDILLFFDALYQKGGYYVVDRHDNVLCEHCTELLVSKVCAIK